MVRVNIEEKIKVSPSFDKVDMKKIDDVIKILDDMSYSAEEYCIGEARNIQYIADQLRIITSDHYYNIRTEEDEEI